MRITFRLLIIVLSVFAGYGQEIRLNKGQLNQGLRVNDSLKNTYTLYIPSSFDPQTPTKILYVFSADGDGVRSARLFMASIQRDDFVIASNDFPLSDDFEANINNALSMIERSSATVKIDPKGIYLAGLDEGARVASGLTYLIGNIAGVLSVNDIFMRYDAEPKKKNEIVYGLTGNASPNYYAMHTSFNRLKLINKRDRLFEYDGEGGWPRLDYLSSVLNTLFFSRADADNEEVPLEYVKQSFAHDSTTVNTLVKRQDYMIAYDLINELKDKYRGLIKLHPLRESIQKLRGNRGYKEEKNTINSQAEDEALLLDDLNYYLDNDLFLASFDNLGYWDERVQQFKAAAKNPSKPYEQQVAKRMLGFINNFIDGYWGNVEQSKLNADQRIYFYVLKTVVNSDDYASFRKVISLAAKDNDENTAYFYLEQMLKNGYTDYNAVYTIPNTETMRISPVFNRIVKKYFDKSKYQ